MPDNISIAIIQSVLKQYRVPLFAGLAERLTAKGIDLRVLYSDPNDREATRADNVVMPDNDHFVRVPARWYWNGRILHQQIADKLAGTQFVIVEHAAKYLETYRMMSRCGSSVPKVACWGHGYNRQAQHWSPADPLRRWLLAHADWYFAYTDGTRQYLERHGFPGERISVVQNATDTADVMRMVQSVPIEVVGAARQRLGIRSSDAVGIFIGSLYPQKLIPFLIEAAREVRRSIPRFHLVIVGAGPDQRMVEAAAATSDGAIHYVGPVFGEARAAYLSMASVFLNPGLVGLAILDAFAAQLPVITTDFEYHSPEIEYLRHDHNGLMIQQDPSRYAQAVVALLRHDAHLARLRRGAFETAQSHTMSAMLERFGCGVLDWLRFRGKKGDGGSSASGADEYTAKVPARRL